MDETINETDTLETSEEAEETSESSSEESSSTEEETSLEEISREEFNELKRQNAQLYARAKKAEEKAGKSSSESKGDEEFRPRVEFLLSNRDINAEEYDHLAAVAMRSFGKITLESLKDAKKSEAEYLSYLRKKIESKNKAPNSTPASALQKLAKTSEEIAKMTSAEHRQYEEQMMRAQHSGI